MNDSESQFQQQFTFCFENYADDFLRTFLAHDLSVFKRLFPTHKEKIPEIESLFHFQVTAHRKLVRIVPLDDNSVLDESMRPFVDHVALKHYLKAIE